MLFNSQPFLLFFLPAVLLIDAANVRLGLARIPALIALSCAFYAWWYPPYIVLLAASILVNWTVAKSSERAPKSPLITLAVAANLAVLAWFKYAGFLVESWDGLTGAALARPEVVLPLAISFFTFHHIAYLVDLRRGDASPTSLQNYALLISFFPHLLAGPIVRYREFVPQLALANDARPRMEMAGRGIALFVIGLAKKLLLADELAGAVNQLYAMPHLGFAEAWIACLGFTFQIYFDFSGYTDMALGLALMLGYELPKNFNSPYRSTSVIEFWRRWHMTLSRFLRDYLYIPLGGSRFGFGRQIGALLATMILGGLWHGAAWTFVLWGALHGLALTAAHVWRRLGLNLPALLGWGLTFFFVAGTFVLFRATSIGQGAHILASLGGFNGLDMTVRLQEAGWRPALLGSPVRDIVVLMGVAAVVVLALPNSDNLSARLQPARTLAWGLGAAFVALTILVGRGAQEFVYFQF